MAGLMDILLIGAVGLGAAYFFNIAGVKCFVSNLGMNCPFAEGCVMSGGDYGACVPGP